MAGQTDLNSGSVSGNSSRDDVRTHFTTREGVYKLIPLAEYSRANRLSGYTTIQNQQGAALGQGSNPPVRVTFVSLPSDPAGFCDRICFNYGRELYFYTYKGTKKPADLSKPVDKRIYKGTSPTCHDINKLTISSESVMLLVGFTGGQIQLVDPIRKEIGKLYNEERIIEKTKVTCIKWLPGSPNLFLVSHVSGQMYLYSEDVTCGGPVPPTYQLFKQGAGFSVWTCKAKSTRNPIYRWVIGNGAINDFAFSPCSKYLAIVSQDGCLRVLNYDAMELVGLSTSFFGGLLCVCWSPDGQLVVAGGEDDLVTVWSFQQKRIVARGQGHRSWITVVAFDPFTTLYSSQNSSSKSSKEGADTVSSNGIGGCEDDLETNSADIATCYRLGSIAMDTQLCLWELTDDVLKQPYGSRSRASMVSGPGSPPTSLKFAGQTPTSGDRNSSNILTVAPINATIATSIVSNSTAATPVNTAGSLTQRLASLTFSERKAGQDLDLKSHRKNFSLGSGKNSSEKSTANSSAFKSTSSAPSSSSVQSQSLVTGCADPLRLIGTQACPRLDEIPMLEPLVCKKVSHERLTALIFREDCLITACQDGIVCTWARPMGPSPHHTSNSTPTNEGTMV
ncbi:WD repeat-containing protein 20 [Daphnia magna]|uniref:WD repeat-containing protein 20 n=1 Tax=Daphnia magna TaxID=35525 RepID=A0A0P5WU06_9CRUS|nr:WD repeat-containing protein 20 [Daphnia magna]